MRFNLAELAERAALAASDAQNAAAVAYGDALAAEPFGGERVDAAGAEVKRAGRRAERALSAWQRAETREKRERVRRRERAELRARIDAAQRRVNARLEKRALRDRPENRPGLKAAELRKLRERRAS